jgi:hypothetical protein
MLGNGAEKAVAAKEEVTGDMFDASFVIATSSQMMIIVVNMEKGTSSSRRWRGSESQCWPFQHFRSTQTFGAPGDADRKTT